MRRKKRVFSRALWRGALAGLLLAMGVAMPALAVTPFDYERFDGSGPVIDYNQFREFFLEKNGGYSENDRTDKPYTEAEIKKLWQRLKQDRPELKPYLDGNYDFVPHNLRAMGNQAMQDMESTLHSVLALQNLGDFQIDGSAGEARRIMEILTKLGPGRVGSAVQSFNKLDPREAILVLDSIGVNTEQLRPFLRNLPLLQQQLRLLPDSQTNLRPFGGVEGIARLLQQLRLPAQQSLPESRETTPAPKPAASIGSFYAAALPLQVSLVDPGNTTPQIINNDPETPNQTVGSGTVGGGISTTDTDVIANTGFPPATPARREKPSGDNIPQGCPAVDEPAISGDDGKCVNADVSSFQNFDAALKEANDMLAKIGDITQINSDLSVLADASMTGGIAAMYPQSQQEVQGQKANIAEFEKMGEALKAARAKLNGDKAKNVDLLIAEHTQILAGLKRVQMGSDLTELNGLMPLFKDIGEYGASARVAAGASTALTKLPDTGSDKLKKLQETVKLINSICSNGMLRELNSAIKGVSQAESQFDSSILSSVLGNTGLSGIITTIAKIVETAEIIMKWVNFAVKVAQLALTLKAFFQLADLGKGMAETQSQASDYADASDQLQEVARGAQYASMPLTNIKNMLDTMKKIDEKVGDQVENIAQGAAAPTAQDFSQFMGDLRAVDADLRSTPAALGNVSQEWTNVVNSTGAASSLSAHVNAFGSVDAQINATLKISHGFAPKNLQNLEKYVQQVPMLLNKLNGMPNLRTELTKLTDQFAKVLNAANYLRFPICPQLPFSTGGYCLGPINWPVSQATIFRLISNFGADRRYQSYKQQSTIAYDYTFAKGFGSVIAGMKYALIDKAMGFPSEPILDGVAGSVPQKPMVPYSTPAVSPLNLNEGWLSRYTCQTKKEDYGILTDDYLPNANPLNTQSAKSDVAGYKDPRYVRASTLQPTLDPQIKGVINAAPIAPLNCDKAKDDGCYSPFMQRLMMDSWANQVIMARAFYPYAIEDTQVMPGISKRMCQQLFIVPSDECLEDEQGNCLKDKDRNVKLDEFGGAWKYIRTAAVQTLMLPYLAGERGVIPIPIHPRLTDPNQSGVEYDMEKEYTLQEMQDLAKKYMREHAGDPEMMPQLKAPGISYFYDTNLLGFGAPKKRDFTQIPKGKDRIQLQDLQSNGVETVYDVTDWFSPRFDFEDTERNKYSKCTRTVLLAKDYPKYCGQGFMGTGLGTGYLEYGETVACASTPTDIMTFRAKRFDNCIMCRINTNKKCLWSEVTEMFVVSIIIEIIRWVIEVVVEAVCDTATLGMVKQICEWLGKAIRRIFDLVLFDPMGHNKKKDLVWAPTSDSDEKCDKDDSFPDWKGCRRVVSPPEALALLNRKPQNSNDKITSNNQYDTTMMRWITGSEDPTEDMMEGDGASDFSLFQAKTWQEGYSYLVDNMHEQYVQMLEPYAKKYAWYDRGCRDYPQTHDPDKCDKARKKFKKRFKKGFEKAKDKAEGGVDKIGLLGYCRSIKTKEGRKLWPPCSTRFDQDDKDQKTCSKFCKTSIKQCCHDLAKPLPMINQLRLVSYTRKEMENHEIPEGMGFTEYYGTHRPFMRKPDTNSDAGGYGMRLGQVDYHSDDGAYVRIAGVGREGNSCKIGGWGFDPKNPTQRFIGDSCVKLPDKFKDFKYAHPLTSGSELKEVLARNYRYNRLFCLPQQEKLFKQYGATDGALRTLGGVVQIARNERLPRQEWPLSHRGFPQWGTKEEAPPETAFPNFGLPKDKPAKIRTGLDNAEVGRILVVDSSVFKQAYPNVPNIERLRRPIIGVITAVNNDTSKSVFETFSNEDKGYSVTIRQMNAGVNIDACGNSDMMGYSTLTTIYKYNDALMASTASGGIGAKLKRMSAAKTASGDAVTTPLCQLNPMLRACTFQDAKADKNIWELAKVYNPYGDDYRGGCLVRPTKDTPDDKRIDLNKIALKDLSKVPTEDILQCLNHGYDPPLSSRRPIDNAIGNDFLFNTLCAPGYEGDPLATRRLKPLGKSDPMYDANFRLFKLLSDKPDIRRQGCPRATSSSINPLRLDVAQRLNLNVNLQSPIDMALPGKNALEKLYGYYQLMRKEGVLGPVKLAAGATLPLLPCGGALQLATGQGATPKYSGFNPITPFGTPAQSNPTSLNNTMRIGEFKLVRPIPLGRSSAVPQNEDAYLTGIDMNQCPGFKIPQLDNDQFHLVLKGCADEDNCPRTTLSGSTIYADGEMLVTTPPDTLMQIPSSKGATIHFPYGFAFRHQCKKMVTIPGDNKITVGADGMLTVTEGESAGKKFPLHDDGGVYSFKPFTGYVPQKGDAMSVDTSVDLIPAVNTQPSEDLDMPDKPITESIVDDHLTTPAYDNTDDGSPNLSDVSNVMNDICSSQDDQPCDNLDPVSLSRGYDEPDGYNGEECNTNPDSLNCKLSQNQDCQADSQSPACIKNQFDPCGVSPGSQECQDHTNYCGNYPDDPVCTAATCDTTLSKEDYGKCVTGQVPH